MKKQTEPILKKPLVQLILALLLWSTIFVAFLRFGGGGLTLFYEIPPGGSTGELRFEPEGIVRVAERSVTKNAEEISIRLAAVEPGVTTATFRWDTVEDDELYEQEIASTIHALPFGILFDSITWNFSGWEVFTACLSLFLLTAAGIFYFGSLREKKRVYFSYRATAELGLAIFCLVASFLRMDMIFAFLRGENAGTVWSLLVGTIVTAQTFMQRTAFVIAGFALVVAISNLVLMRHEGTRPSNMLGIAVSLVMVGGAAFGIWMSRSLVTFPLRNVLLNVYAGLFVYLECLLAATVIRAVQAGRHEPAYDRDFILVLGCKIRPDGTLYPLIRARVDRAIDFAETQYRKTGKRAVLIPSGGQGADEPVPEGEAMARYMRERGVPEAYILPETQSKTTRENLLFSRKRIGPGWESAKAAFSTSSYHVYRGGILAAEEGWNLEGMGSKTKWYFWPNAFLREFIGLMAAQLPQQVITAAVIAAISASVTWLVM